VQHLFDRDFREAALPAAHHPCLGFGKPSLARVVLKRVRGEQIDAREPVLEFGCALEQKEQLLTCGDWCNGRTS
jgi:hypothetical protein